MENQTTQKNLSYSVPRELMERFLYGLATLIFCAVPFLIPGISVRGGVMIFFGSLIVLVIGVIVFSVVVNRKKGARRGR